MKTKSAPRTIGIVSLGCAKNLVDTETLMRQIKANELQIIVDPQSNQSTDTIIINTCGFISDAKQESIDTILQFVDAKNKGNIRELIVMGCLSERYKEQLTKEIPEVDGFYGVNELKKIILQLGGHYRTELIGERVLTTPAHTAYLKIAEGCNRTCSFCAIPQIRGKHLSKSIEEIVQEAIRLVESGVKEINVISQDTTYYGLDLYGERRIADLLEKLAAIDKLQWLRLHYTYPNGFPLRLLDVIRDHPKICKYIDIPLQHISTRILKSMHRGTTEKETLELLNQIRSTIPGVAIRTTLIVGYPGETNQDFNLLKRFIQEAQFDRLGVFPYSHEENTSAFLLKDSVSNKIKQARVEEIMGIQEGISAKINETKVGRTMKVLIDRRENEYLVGRTEYDSPEIDNEVLIEDKMNLDAIGQFYQVHITSSDSFDLFGTIGQG